MKSFDRAHKPGVVSPGFLSNNLQETWQDEPGQLVRCVPWPEGAPDPSTVPQAGEKVTLKQYMMGWVYTVVNGIPNNNKKDDRWEVEVVCPDGTHDFLPPGEFKVFVEPVPERTYTEAEIRSAILVNDGEEVIKALRRQS